MINENYYVVLGWMVNELKLKGNEKDAYAVIYGLTQNGERQARVSLDYLSKALGCDKKTVQRVLLNLIKKGLISKKLVQLNGQVCNEYLCNPVFSGLYRDMGKMPTMGKMPSNNLYTINNSIKDNGTKQYSPNNANSRGLSPIQYSPNGVIEKKRAGNRVLISPKTRKIGAKCDFNAPDGVRVLLTQLEGGEPILSAFNGFTDNCKQLGMIPTKMWYRAQIDILNAIEDSDDKLEVIRKTIENGWKNLRFIAERMFGKDLVVKTKVGGKKSERKTKTY